MSPRTIGKDLWFDFLLVMVSSAVVAVSIIVAWSSAEWHWFSISGAILLLGGAIVEYRNSVFFLDGNKSYKFMSQDGVAMLEEGWKANVFLKVTAHAMVICGTLIAGYGDLLGQGCA